MYFTLNSITYILYHCCRFFVFLYIIGLITVYLFNCYLLTFMGLPGIIGFYC